MGKKSDITPRKIAKVTALLQNSDLSQREIARRMQVSPQALSVIKRKLDFHGTASPRRTTQLGKGLQKLEFCGLESGKLILFYISTIFNN